MCHFVCEGESRHPLRHWKAIPAERDNSGVEAFVHLYKRRGLDMSPMCVTNASIFPAGCPGETQGASREVSEREEVGETMITLVDVAQPIEQIFKAQIQGAQVEPQNGAAGVINDLDLLEDQTIFLVTQVAAAKDPVG